MTPPRGFNAAEISQIKSKGITSLTGLWERVGKDFDQGLAAVSADTGVTVDRLREVLASKGAHEFEVVGESLGRPRRMWWKRTRHTVKRYWLEVAGSALALLILFLVLRAAGLTASWPAPLGVRERVVVAARDLDAGTLIRAGDLFTARLSAGDDYFHDAGELSGLILAQSVRERRPLRYKDVSRLQVVAKGDIPGGKTITADDVALGWTPFQRNAFESAEQVRNKVATKAIRGGDVVLGDFIADAGAAGTSK